jgi:hypothetical protein
VEVFLPLGLALQLGTAGFEQRQIAVLPVGVMGRPHHQLDPLRTQCKRFENVALAAAITVTHVAPALTEAA